MARSMKTKRFLSPSILSADFAHLAEQVKALEDGGADWVHCDVMDGHFVPNLTFGAPVIKSLRGITKLPLDVHLMIANPDLYIEDFAAAGSDYITVHQEATDHLHRVVEKIKKLGAKAGISINPSTPVSALYPMLEYADMVLIMSVNPGFGGQSFISSTLKKVNELKEIREKNNLNYIIEIDGGLNDENISSIVKAGCDAFVIGSSIFTGNIIERAKFFQKEINSH
jgi:ribulose-phosphate 3-epimerase